MEYKLDQIEGRVLGVLMEKAMTQPDYYPMTLNAVLAACNQKSNRDPVMNLDELTVDRTLEGLKKRGLVAQVLPAPGARTNRYKHQVESCFGWSARQRAIMAELLLRGPQTVGELRSRCSRMIAFESLDIVSQTLQSLADEDPPLTAAIPREPGRSAIRHTRLMCPEDEQPSPVPTPTADVAQPADVPAQQPRNNPPQAHLRQLQEDIFELRKTLEDVVHRLEDLEGRIRG